MDPIPKLRAYPLTAEEASGEAQLRLPERRVGDVPKARPNRKGRARKIWHTRKKKPAHVKAPVAFFIALGREAAR
jgi:hypothetical protein